MHAWHWPDHRIGKRESRRLRDEHNALFNHAHELLDACKALVQWIENNAPTPGDPQAEWCDQLDVARFAIDQAERKEA